MSIPMIKVNNLSKRYRIGAAELPYKTIRETIMEGITAPVRNLGRLRSLTRFKEGYEENVIWALKDISFEMNEGEVLGIIGKNGAGKTTLLKVLSRITEPTSGSVEMRGKVSSLLEVGTGFHPELTGRENIFLNGAILGMRKKEIERKFDDIVSFAEVEKFIDTPVKRFSSGMQVRLAFAVAAHLEPEIMLIDEVLAVGDYQFQKKCFGKMGDIAQQGRTILVVSHNMQSIMNLCQRAILLEEGKLVMNGPVDQVVSAYIASGQGACSEMVWPEPSKAPGNKDGRLNSVRILADNGEPASELDLSKDIIIQIKYWCLKDGARLTPGLVVVNQMNVEVLETHTATGINVTPDKPYDFPHKVGLYQVECRVPANLLNEGTYTIILGFFGMVGYLVEKDTLSFHVYDTGSNPKPDNRPWRGVVRTKLGWSTEYLGNE